MSASHNEESTHFGQMLTLCIHVPRTTCFIIVAIFIIDRTARQMRTSEAPHFVKKIRLSLPPESYSSSISSSPKSSAGNSPASHRSGRTKTPQLLPHSKYRFPCTDPSFLPVGSSSVMPIQTPMPGISGIAPMYDTVPLRASDSGRRRTRHERLKPVCSCQYLLQSLLKPVINIADAVRSRPICEDHARCGDGRRAGQPVKMCSCRSAIRVVGAAHR
jgi:hypothetical protein